MQNASLKYLFLPALGVAENYYSGLAEELKKQLCANVSIISPPSPGGWGQRLSASAKVGYPEMVDEISKAVQD